MAEPTLDPILITGCSSGIGHAAAQMLVRAGHTTYATARRVETLADLERAGAHTLSLDVTSEESMQSAVSQIEAEHGYVGTLVNNAGYGEYGTIEETDLDRVREMFETNVFGLARLIQLVLPAMRARRSGRIVNISSMGGRFAWPVGGYYHSTKYAVEALSDALRNEVRQFGINVVVVEPGPIRSRFEETINATMADRPSADDDSPYADLVSRVQAANAKGYAGPAAADPDVVARRILRIVEAESPRRRYVVTPAAKALVAAKRFGGDRVWDQLVRQQYGR